MDHGFADSLVALFPNRFAVGPSAVLLLGLLSLGELPPFRGLAQRAEMPYTVPL